MSAIRQATSIAALVTSLAATAAPATAAGPFDPAVIADATHGREKVSAAVYVAPRSAQLLGVWTQTGVSCSATRRMRISADFRYTPSPSGTSRHYAITRTFRVGNCAEGGPNTGFTLRAFRRRAACPGGLWHPGEYQLETVATDLHTGLGVTASADFTITRPCPTP